MQSQKKTYNGKVPWNPWSLLEYDNQLRGIKSKFSYSNLDSAEWRHWGDASKEDYNPELQFLTMKWVLENEFGTINCKFFFCLVFLKESNSFSLLFRV